VLSLINLAELANVIDPETYQPNGISPHNRKVIIYVRLRARMLLAWLNSCLEIRLEHRIVDLAGFAEDFLRYQMGVMKVRKQFYDTQLATVPSITIEALDKELRGCRVDFSTILDNVQDLVIAPALSLPRHEKYEVLAKTVVTDIPADISGETFSDLEWQKNGS
jgi:hypothetical protein